MIREFQTDSANTVRKINSNINFIFTFDFQISPSL